MRSPLFYQLLLFCACAFGANALAQEIPLPVSRANDTKKIMLVVEFGDASPPGSKLDDAIAQAKREFPTLESVSIPDERALEKLLEERADGSIGMVVLMHPQDTETLSKVPGLYPDMAFTMIDTFQPVFAANVQSVQFKEDEGAFLLGAISAIRSNNRITIMTLEETPRSKLMSESFSAGVRHIRPKAALSTLTNINPTATQRTRLASAVTTVFQEGTAILFSMDDEIIEHALRAAKPERKIVISGNAPTQSADTTRLMTYMVKRYDLALLDVLRIYNHKQWHAGTITLGVSGGYVDYSLNAENVDIFPKDSIDQIEAIKDYIGQGMYLKTP